ncbi:MAG: glycosyltransferase [Clostridium sp.]|nr:glycosyltransferase [Clostridium sp.]
MKKVSVIIPSYNSADTIERCINSVLDTNKSPLEIIVVNDGSSDNTEQILKAYGDRIKYITVENQGVSNARNIGLKEAAAPFVMFMDADDYMDSGAIDKLLSEQEKTGADIVRCTHKYTYENGEEKPCVYDFKKKGFFKKDEFHKYIYPYFINGIMMNTVCMSLFKRELLEGLQFRLDMHTAEDAVFEVEVYTRAKSVYVAPYAFYNYYQGTGSLTGSGLRIAEKYRCNLIFSHQMAKHLKQWNMNTPLWHIRVWLRPLILTFNKLKRLVYNTH